MSAIGTTAIPSSPSDPEKIPIYDAILKFALGSDAELVFPEQDGKSRRNIHQLAAAFHFIHESVGTGDKKSMVVKRATEEQYNCRF